MDMTDRENTQLINSQKYLGDKGLVAFIALMNAFIPLSTDLYLPALPSLSSYFASNSAITNLTLSSFFFFYAVGILLWGPLSDKYGRKPILLFGTTIYIISSYLCAISNDIYLLIFARIIQGIGAGGITSVSVAIIKDCYSAKKREIILAITQSISGLAPMIAPIIGAWILNFVDWRGSFWLLTIIGIINLILTFLYKDTLKENERYTGTIIGALSRLVILAKNKGFFIPTVLFSMNTLPFMGYIAISSYIYVDYFKLSEQAYSYFFAASALISILGPFIYVRFIRRINNKTIPILCFSLAVLSGVLVMSVGTFSPIMFLLSFTIMSLTCTAIRPFSTNLLFEQQKGDTGSASSLISTISMIFGSIGMLIASMPWNNPVVRLGIVITFFSCLSIIGWVIFIRSNIPCIGIKDENEPNRMMEDDE